ncbi:MAG: Bax inhibitor-1/YccA family protein [Planctomycetes bacterium]|nr:Bax inhibitor-1/YccA family protein [Planctomycetota bacterium]
MFGSGSSNPALNKDVFAPAQTWEDLERQGRSVRGVDFNAAEDEAAALASAEIAAKRDGRMTMQGTINKSFFLLALVVTGALGTWMLLAEQRSPGLGLGLTFGGAIVGVIAGLVMAFWPKGSAFLAPVYGIAQGAFVGGISSFYAMQFGGKAMADGKVVLNTGLIFNASLLTFGIAGATLALYGFKVIRPGRMFHNAVAVGFGGLILYILAALVAGWCGFPAMSSVFDPTNGGMISLGFSGLLLLLGAASFVTDYDMVSNGVKNRAEKYYEWYGAYAIMATLVFVYIQALRLMAKLTSRRE